MHYNYLDKKMVTILQCPLVKIVKVKVVNSAIDKCDSLITSIIIIPR